jgi:hypothetical protein
MVAAGVEQRDREVVDRGLTPNEADRSSVHKKRPEASPPLLFPAFLNSLTVEWRRIELPTSASCGHRRK